MKYRTKLIIKPRSYFPLQYTSTHNNVYILVTGRPAILLLHLLGVLPSLQCRLRFSIGTTNADERKIIRHLPSLLLLCSQDGRGLTNGICASHHLCSHLLLDGWTQAIVGYICVNPLDHAFQCAGLSRNRPCTWCHSNGCETGHNLSFSDYVGVSFEVKGCEFSLFLPLHE